MKKNVFIQIEDSLHKKAKVLAASLSMSMGKIFEKALAEFLDKQKIDLTGPSRHQDERLSEP